MSEWNPNTTNKKGLEWAPPLLTGVTLDALTKCAAVSLVQTAAQATGAVKLYVGAIAQRNGIYAVEVYDDETGVSGANLAYLTALPNEDVSGTGSSAGLWRTNSGATTTIYTAIDDGGTPNTSDYIRNLTSGTDPGGYASYVGRIATAALSLTGKRILGIRCGILCDNNNSGVSSGVSVSLNIGGAEYEPGWAFSAASNGADTSAYSSWLMFNPATKRPWTIADIQAFDSTDEYALNPYIDFIGSGNATPLRVFSFGFEIAVCDETRLALGGLDDVTTALTANGWNSVTLVTPAGGTWTKDGSGSHLYTVRRCGGMVTSVQVASVGSLVIPQLYDPAGPPSIAKGWLPTLDASWGYITAMGVAQPQLMGLVQRTTAPADSVDSLPYAVQVEAKVYNGQTAQQEFSNAAASTYTEASVVLVKPNGAVGDLTLKVKRRSDNVQLGSTVTFTAAEVAVLADAGNGWKRLTRQMASGGVLATGTQYYIEVADANAADDGTTTKYWSVLTLDVGDATTGVTAGFGGTTDRATINGAEADRYDIPATVAIIPVTPANFAAAVSTVAIDSAVGCATGLQYAHLTWTATAIGGLFLRYDIQRSDDAGVTWTDIVRISTEATAAFDDYEGMRGVAAQYRIRTVGTDLTTSAWAATVTATPVATKCEIAFTSNYDPSFNLIFDVQPDIRYDPQDDLVTLPIYGRDHRLAFRGTEAPGTVATYMLHVGVDTEVPGGGGLGLEGFRPLIDLSRAQLPYVCVLDHYGNRVFATLRLPQAGELHNPHEKYSIDVDVISVTDEPYLVLLP